MRKYLPLVLSAFSLIENFVLFWYRDTLLNRFFIFGLVPHAISVFTLLCSLIVFLVCVIRQHSKKEYYYALAVSAVTVIVLFVFPFRMAKVNLELQLFEDDRLQIIEMVKNGDITTDNLGNAKLPDGFGMLSSDGEIFVYQNDSEQVISFWVFRGMLSGSVELIYSSTDESLIYENETGHPIISVDKLKEHWYLVDTDY